MAVQAVSSSLDDLRLRGRTLRADISNAIVGEAPVKRTISSASSVNLTVFDPNCKLLRDPFMNERSRIEIDQLLFDLVQIKRNEDDTDSLTFEDSAVSKLRRLTGPKKAFRDRVTRAEFVTSLAREAGIDCVSPWRRVEQPIKKNTAVGVRVLDEAREPGIDRTVRLTVKGTKANSTQIETADKALRSTFEQFPKVPRRAVLALLCALTHESVMGTLGMTPATISDHDSVGPLQARLSYVSAKNAMDMDYNVRRFMAEPWTGTSLGGAIKQAEAGRTIGEICTSIQGNSTGDIYTQWKDEAERWLEAFGGGGLSSYSVTTEVRYAFQVKKDENYWDAIKRLAKEVNWRTFVSAGKLYFMSEPQLLRSRPRLRIGADHTGTGTKNYRPGIDAVTFDIASNKPTNAAQISGRANTWQAPPGTVVILEDFGPADGKWLVSDIETDLTTNDFVAKLKRPSKPLPEPVAATRTRTVKGSPEAAAGKGAERAVAWAKKMVGVKQGSDKYNYWMGKVGGYDPWCSFWIGFLMREVCGLECSNFGHSSYWLTWSGGKRVSTSNIKPGDIVVYDWGNGGDTDHVALYIGGGLRIGGNETPSVVAQNPANLSSAVGVVRPNYE